MRTKHRTPSRYGLEEVGYILAKNELLRALTHVKY